MDFPIAKRTLKSTVAAIAAATVVVLLAGNLSGCGSDETKPLETKDLPADMKVSEENRITQPTGTPFTNPSATKGGR